MALRVVRRSELLLPLPNPPPRSLRSLGREFCKLDLYTGGHG